MKVALELQPCCGNRSGIGTYTYELAKRLRNGDRLEFAGNVFNFLHRNDNASTLAGIQMPVRTQTCMPYGVYRRIWHMVPFSYGMMFPEADLSVFFNYIVPPRVKGKIITTIHDMTYLRFPETMDRRNLTRITKDIRSSVARSNHILAVSEFSKQEIIELLKVEPEKISVVYNAPSVPAERVSANVLAERYSVQSPYLLYVGTIEPRKNLARLIRAYEQLRDESNFSHQLVLAGGNGWGTEEVHRTAQESKYTKDIIFTGYISGAEKSALYAGAAAFLFPSLYEGFGIPPLEAMRFGCPVVCADAASLPEVVGEAAVLVDPMNTASISRGIWRVLSDVDYAARLSALGSDQVEKFTWEASAQKLTEICRRVLEEP